MNFQLRRTLLAAGVLLAAGIVRMPVEQALTSDLRAQGMLGKPLELETRIAGDAGTPIALGDGPAAQAYARLAKRLIAGGMA